MSTQFWSFDKMVHKSVTSNSPPPLPFDDRLMFSARRGRHPSLDVTNATSAKVKRSEPCVNEAKSNERNDRDPTSTKRTKGRITRSRSTNDHQPQGHRKSSPVAGSTTMYDTDDDDPRQTEDSGGDQSTPVTKMIGVKRKRDENSDEETVDGKTVKTRPYTRRRTARLLGTETQVVREADRETSQPKAVISATDTSNVSHLDDPSQTSLNSYLDVLLYQDGELKPLTHNTLKLIEDVKSHVDEANALFLEGLCSFRNRLELLSTAEKKGCDHPIMYYFLGECYKTGDKGVKKDNHKSLEYYTKAIAGMWTVMLTQHNPAVHHHL